MRLTLVGPAYPWRGGIPLLTTDLAHRLIAAGHQVRLRTWTSQGPGRMLPAQRHPLGRPESHVFPAEPEPLSWRNPAHWRRIGELAAAESDLVVPIHYTTVQAPALSVIAGLARRRARVVVICANAVPHESRPGDRRLTGLLMRAADGVLVHTAAERAAMQRLTARPVGVAALPPHLPEGDRRPVPVGAEPLRRLLFFGKVRPYKGVDVLLRALVGLEGVGLSIVGEFYQDVGRLQAMVDGLGLTDRVQVHPDYLPAERIPELFAQFDALVLPYRSATASQHVALAHHHGLPVVVTSVGNFPDTVRDGVDGLICAPGEVADLRRVLRELYRPGRLAQLRAGVRPAEVESTWRAYLATLDELAALSARGMP
jgi:glycosyltransferase involved in cell wall biosynthesis